MLTRLCAVLSFGLPVLLCLSASPAIAQEPPEYEVYAIEYAVLPERPLSGFLPGADSILNVAMSAMVWLIQGPDGQNILVDAGYRPDYSNATSRQMQEYVRPDLAVGKLGISPEEISDIILTHLHWDHADGIPLFPNAHVWVQEAELDYYADRARETSGDSTAIEPRYLRELMELNAEGGVTLVEGDDQEIFPGIRVYTGPKHTFASQYVGVNTSGGTVIVASDCAWFYANLELGLANSLTLDPEADLEAFERMRQLASRLDWILPGHDPRVFEKFPSPGQGVAHIR